MLCETIGARPTGSSKNKTAVDYAFDVLQKCGFQTRKQEFNCLDWIKTIAVLWVNNVNVPVEPAEYSLPCDIEAEFVCIDTVNGLQMAELAGKIAVLHGDLCKEPLMPKNFKFYNPDEHKQVIALLEKKNPSAIITVSSQKEHIIQDGDFNIPCAVVHEKLLEHFLEGKYRKAKLTIVAKRVQTKAHNVIATYGTGHNKVCFSAHIDTKSTTPGALDNASGVAVLLSLAALLSNKEYPLQIEIVLLNGEDYYSTPGEIAYMNLLTADYYMAINVDGVGLKESVTAISFYEFPKQLKKRIMECVERTEGIEQTEPWPMGDHMMFANYKIPVIAITASGIYKLLDTVLHSPDDNMKNVDFKVLNNIVDFLLRCISKIEI